MKNDQPQDYNRISTAYHEAGHAIFALLNTIKIDRVEIFSSTQIHESVYTAYGVTSFFSFLNYTKDKFLQNYFVRAELEINYAGGIAEKILYKKITGSSTLPPFLSEGSSFDIKNSNKIIKKYKSIYLTKKINDYQSKIEKKISKILTQHWNDVEIISHLLLDKAKINHQDVKRAFLKKSENKDFWRRKFKVIDSIIGRKNFTVDEQSVKLILKSEI
jgi:ATP-dependent Zn protease